MLTSNVGGFDRFARIFIGMVLLAAIFVGPRTLWGLIGLVPFLTGVFRTCPIYSLLGVNTSWRGPY